MREWIDSFDGRDWQASAGGTVRFALIGLGWWTTEFALPAIEASEFCETTVLVSSSREKAGRVAQAHNVAHGISYEDFHDGAASDAHDAVYICTPNALHLPYAETAADLEKAVLCEKPMEASVERAEQLVAACESADVPLMIAYRMQTDPAVRRARELIDDGLLGEPVSVYGNNSQPLLDIIPDEDQWRLDGGLAGYGSSVMDVGIYSINTTRFLLGEDPIAVQARSSSHHEAFADVPDERSGSLLAFDDGLTMVSTSSQNAQEDTQLKITGTDGQIELRPAFHGQCTLHISRGEATVTVEHDGFDAQREMREQFDYFADRILTDVPIYPNGEHGLEDMRIISAIYRAAETGDVVEL